MANTGWIGISQERLIEAGAPMIEINMNKKDYVDWALTTLENANSQNLNSLLDEAIHYNALPSGMSKTAAKKTCRYNDRWDSYRDRQVTIPFRAVLDSLITNMPPAIIMSYGTDFALQQVRVNKVNLS